MTAILVLLAATAAAASQDELRQQDLARSARAQFLSIYRVGPLDKLALEARLPVENRKEHDLAIAFSGPERLVVTDVEDGVRRAYVVTAQGTWRSAPVTDP